MLLSFVGSWLSRPTIGDACKTARTSTAVGSSAARNAYSAVYHKPCQALNGRLVSIKPWEFSIGAISRDRRTQPEPFQSGA